jgi:hypothetical protein
MIIDNTTDPNVQKQLRSEVQRFQLINHLIKTHQFKKYLEIGIFDGYTFNKIECQTKHGVDPGVEGITALSVTHRMPSDDFFEICTDTYDIIFIDGLHEYHQVVKDFNNSLKYINYNGYILLHDCNPVDELSQNPKRETVSWNGDVWKAFLLIKSANPHAFVLDTDFGIGVVHANQKLYPVTNIDLDMAWSEFVKDKQSLLSLVTVNDINTIDLNNI